MAAPGHGAPAGSSQGERIGKYQIITQLSVGGMAELFLGFTAGPGGFRKYVALKRILPEVRSNAAFERMFLDEARITAAFTHPNISQVYELGQEEDGLFLAMEFIAGQNLDQLTNAYRRLKQPIPLGLSVAILRDVSQALHYAHTFTDPSGRPSPIVHRDVAQKNIMVTYDGVVKLLDFGIAKARNSLERTRVGTVKGTAGYMSPEQVRGEPLDGRSDVFSAGVVLWELVTGERLFAGKTEREEMMNILQAPIPPPRHPSEPVSESLSAAILQALERDPAKRFQSGKEFARALEQAAGPRMFDTDRRAAVMRELFERKMATTRALLESAETLASQEPEPMPPAKAPPRVAPPRAESQKKRRAAPMALPGSGGTALYEEKVPAERTDVRPQEPAREPTTRAAPPTREDATANNKTLNGVLWAGVLLSIILGGGYLVMTLTPSLNESVTPQPEPQPFVDSRLKEFPEPGQPPPVPRGTATDAGTVASGTAVAEEKEKEKEGGEKTARAHRGPQGKMTLIIHPEAEVFRGKRSLGRTPLFNQLLPVGTHLLRIVGPDKKPRVLSVQIAEGETAKYRFSLSDLPEAR